jgi:hypothetical protein
MKRNRWYPETGEPHEVAAYVWMIVWILMLVIPGYYILRDTGVLN